MRPPRFGRGKKARPLSAALENPYRPLFGPERRFEQLAPHWRAGRAAQAARPAQKPGPKN